MRVHHMNPILLLTIVFALLGACSVSFGQDSHRETPATDISGALAYNSEMLRKNPTDLMDAIERDRPHAAVAAPAPKTSEPLRNHVPSQELMDQVGSIYSAFPDRERYVSTGLRNHVSGDAVFDTIDRERNSAYH